MSVGMWTEEQKCEFNVQSPEKPGYSRVTSIINFCVCCFARDDEKTFAWMEKQFRQMAGSNGSLDKEAFKKALQVKQVWTHFSETYKFK